MNDLLSTLVKLCATLSGSDFKITFFVYCAAASSPDRKASLAIREIADGTGLAWRTVQARLRALEKRGVIRIHSRGKEKTLIEIPQRHWPARANAARPAPVVDTAPPEIGELVLRLTRNRASAKQLADLKAAGEEQAVRKCMAEFLNDKRQRWENVDLLIGAVYDALRPRKPYSFS